MERDGKHQERGGKGIREVRGRAFYKKKGRRGGQGGKGRGEGEGEGGGGGKGRDAVEDEKRRSLEPVGYSGKFIDRGGLKRIQ